jgi:hypothetical protein
MKKDTSGPAYPVQMNPLECASMPIDAEHSDEPSLDGLTKREYFAGLAMQGIISNHEFSRMGLESVNDIAAESVLFADALLKELEK